MEENLKTREKTNSHVILTMVMIVLVIIINIIVGKCISKRIDPEEKINELNQQIDQLNTITDSMNDYLKTEIEKQTQKVIDAKKEESQNNEEQPQTQTNEEQQNQEQTYPQKESQTQNEDEVKPQPTEDIVIQEDAEPPKISDSQTNNVNCFVRTLTIHNINMFNNASIGTSTIQTIIENFIGKFNNNFKDLNLIPIGSIIYSIIPIHVSNDVFVYGQYYLRSLINSNTPSDTVYNYQLQLPDNWTKGSDFRFPNMKNRTLQGKTKINFTLTTSEFQNDVDRSINVSDNVKDLTHTELKSVDFIQNDMTTEKIQKGVLRKADFWTKRQTNSVLRHGKSLSDVIYTPKVQDQQTKLFFYVVLGYV